MTTTLATLQDWVDSVRSLTAPDTVHWCDGSESEYLALIAKMQDSGDLRPLNADKYPGCYLHRPIPSDVARVEHLTFVCTETDDAGPNNHWMDPPSATKRSMRLFDGCMQGRTMYVIPYCMGPIDSPYARWASKSPTARTSLPT